jgi:hypothetical protein
MVQLGERFRCADEDCGCEVEITRIPKSLEPEEDEELDAKPLCLCGEEMEPLRNSSAASS